MEIKYIIATLIFLLFLVIIIYKYISFILFTNTRQKNVNEIYQLLKYIHCKFKKSNTNYTIIGGTLLGCIRHEGLIPWDRDADIAVLNKTFKEILEILKPLEKYNITSYLNTYNGIIKVKFIDSDTIIDIFILEKNNDKIYRFTSPYNLIYNNEYFEEYELYPLKLYKFGPLILHGPNLPINYLDRSYPNWQKVAVSWTSEWYNIININIKNKEININKPACPNINILRTCN